MRNRRADFRMGAESLNVAVTTALARRRSGARNSALRFGLNLTASRLGTFAALNSPTWARAAYANCARPSLSRWPLPACAWSDPSSTGSWKNGPKTDYRLGDVSTTKSSSLTF